MQAGAVSWVVKPSKFCNLRCSYCYEWNELSDPFRMSVDTWKNVLQGIKDYARYREEKTGTLPTSFIIWHGGEPLILGAPYWREVLEVQAEIFSEEDFNGKIVNAVQTNLFSLNEDMLSLLQSRSIGIGVSIDFAPGVRLSAGGRSTEPRVLANMQRLRDAGIRFGVIAVLAKHSIDHLCHIHDELAKLGISFRVLPLFRGPEGRPMDSVACTDTEIVDALWKLAEHRIQTDKSIGVSPIDGMLTAAVRKVLDLTVPPFDREVSGEAVFVVDPHGVLFEDGADYGDHMKLGSLCHQTIGEILRSPRYLSSLSASRRRLASVCAGCHFESACDHYPAIADPSTQEKPGCRIALPMMMKLERLVRAERWINKSYGESIESILNADTPSVLTDSYFSAI